MNSVGSSKGFENLLVNQNSPEVQKEQTAKQARQAAICI
jgi:hypothetical protein